MLLAATDRAPIADRLHRFHRTVLAADLPEATRLALTVDAWWPGRWPRAASGSAP